MCNKLKNTWIVLYHLLYLCIQLKQKKMTTVENKISKSKRNLLIVGTLAAIAFAATSCGETEVEPLSPKTVTYTVSGDPDTYAVAYSDNWSHLPVGPYLEKGQKIINMESGYGEVSFEAHPGDSVSVFVIDGSYLNHIKIANVTVSVGNIIIARGSTEETGFYSVRGRVGTDLFKTCER